MDSVWTSYLGALTLGYEEGYLEIAAGWRREGRLRLLRRDGFVAVEDRAAALQLIAKHAAAGREVFAGVVPRLRPEPSFSVVGPSHMAWIDVDDPGVLPGLRSFGRPGHIVVESGSGGVHVYWRLKGPVEDIESVNRSLAAHLRADMAACDRLRLLRVPETVNKKAGRMARLVAVRSHPGYDLDELLDGVERIEATPRGERPARTLHRVPRDWFSALCGGVPDEGGMVACPLPGHADDVASCRVYEDHFYCYGCLRGGSAIDLWSLLRGGPSGRELRGQAFCEAREHVRQLLS